MCDTNARVCLASGPTATRPGHGIRARYAYASRGRKENQQVRRSGDEAEAASVSDASAESYKQHTRVYDETYIHART